MSKGEERPEVDPGGDGVVTSSAAASGELAAVPAEHPVAEREALRGIYGPLEAAVEQIPPEGLLLVNRAAR